MKLCECGCGQPAPIAKRSQPQLGQVKGQQLRFVHGHRLRGGMSAEERRKIAAGVRGHHQRRRGGLTPTRDLLERYDAALAVAERTACEPDELLLLLDYVVRPSARIAAVAA